MIGFFVDLRSSLRSLARTPTYTISVVLALLLGIGANTAFFSIMNTVVLNPFPYQDPDRLVMVWESNPALGALIGPRVAVSWQTFKDWRNQNHVFERIGGFQLFKTNLSGLEKPEELSAGYASSDFFPLLGVKAHLGRVFLPEDEVSGKGQVAVVTSGFASRHFSKGDNPVGHSLVLDGKPTVIVGVLPASFHLPALYAGINEPKPDIWVSLQAMTARDPIAARQQRRFFVAARLKAGVSVEQARGEMLELTHRLAQQDSTLEGFAVNVFPFQVENIEPDFRTALLLQWAALALILMMACATVANLALLRWNAREKEAAVMLALGGNRKRLVSRMVTESGLLVGAAWLLGLLAAYLGIRVVVAIRPSEIYEI
ncbi:MAG TPA: ABC transporter permease, partial [Candidatus Angelobacter sp.]|nr:ABC transporter permease [Candidatus Angelobacter sp.]